MGEYRDFYYARVSSSDQNLARQIEAFKKLGADERDIVCDKQSGKDLERCGYQNLKMNLLRVGDSLTITSLDRLSRNKNDIKNEIQWFKDNGIRLKVIDLPTTMVDYPEGQAWVGEMVFNILVEVLGSMAEIERENIRKRQREGINSMPIKSDGKRYSSRTGKATGRPTIPYPDNWKSVYDLWKKHEITGVQAMTLLDIKKTTFYSFVKKYEELK